MTILSRRARRSLLGNGLAVLLFNGVLFLWILCHPAPHAQFVFVDNLLQALGPLIFAPFCLVGARRLWQRRATPLPHSTQRWATVFIATGIFMYGLGQTIWTWYELAFRQIPPQPYWDDLCFLAAYPFFLLGVLFLPARRLLAASRLRVVLDGVIILIAVTTFSWYFILGPTILQTTGTFLAKLVASAYPLSDVLMIFCLLLLSSQFADTVLRTASRILGGALTVVIITDTLFNYQTLQGTYVTGSLLDVGWPLGYMLIGLATQIVREAILQQAQPTTEQAAVVFATRVEGPQSWPSLLPYVLVPGVLILLVYTRLVPPDNILGMGVNVGSVLVIILSLARQLVAIRETVAYAKDMQQLNEELHLTHAAMHENNTALSEANSRLEMLATTDHLTNLPNHRIIVDTLDRELERARRYQRPFSLLFFDGDRFKRVNDTYGHAIGDVVLCAIGAITGGILRAGDMVGRYGGEEFVVLLPETDGAEALRTAERLRVAVMQSPIAAESVAGELTVTISIGVATFPQDGTTSSELIHEADQAMYWAKRLGRNRVCTVADGRRASQDPRFKHLFRNGDDREALEHDQMSATDALLAEHLEIVYTLIGVLDRRDPGAAARAHAVSDTAAALARELALDRAIIVRVAAAGLLHDIGLIGVPDGVLTKTEPLSRDEREQLRDHPVLGAQILESSPALMELIPAIRHHHEQWDGNGYPDGLAQAAIPIEARIIAVAAAFHARASKHPMDLALTEVQRGAGECFDVDVVAALGRYTQRLAQGIELAA